MHPIPVAALPDLIARCLEEHGQRLHRAAFAILRNPHDAEDAVQTALARALAAVDGFRGEAGTCTWIHRIVINVSIDALRRRPQVAAVDDALVERCWADPDFTVDPVAVNEALEDRRQLGHALDRISPAQRAAVVLHDAEGWTTAEIADMLRIPVPTVKSHLRRGRQALVLMLGTPP
ncbi:MAG: RNA polymerase sigma factor [Candidatus Dormibacteria bacterium]